MRNGERKEKKSKSKWSQPKERREKKSNEIRKQKRERERKKNGNRRYHLFGFVNYPFFSFFFISNCFLCVFSKPFFLFTFFSILYRLFLLILSYFLFLFLFFLSFFTFCIRNGKHKANTSQLGKYVNICGDKKRVIIRNNFLGANKCTLHSTTPLLRFVLWFIS